MKKFYLLVCALMILGGLRAQRVFVGNNPGTSGNIVIGQSNYHVSESIYTEAEIGAGNFTTAGSAIEEVYFLVNTLGINPTINNFRIYMRNVSAATTTFANGIYSTVGYTQVFNGTANAPAVGVMRIILTTPFVRTPGTNLQVLIERFDNVLHTGYVLDAAVGNNIDPNATSSRRVNVATLPVSGVTSLTATNFRPAMAFIHRFPIDAAVNFVGIPDISCYQTPQTFRVVLVNEGLNQIAAGAATVTLRIRGANNVTATQTNAGTIAPEDVAFIDFPNLNIGNPGVNDDTMYVNLAGDGTTYNDSLFTSNITATNITTFPAVEDVEAPGTTPFPIFNYAAPLAGGQLWTVQNGNYSNPDMTNPLVPRAPGANFFLFDSYSGASSLGFESRLFSNCISIPSNSTALMTFYMSHDNAFPTDLDSLYVSISTDGGQTYVRWPGGFQRPDVTATTPVWRIESIDLSPFAGQTIQIGFEGVSKYGNAFGLDDITITVNSLPITLLEFTAVRNGSVNNLKWSTSQEINSSRFAVERSTDGRNFTEIGTVGAAGYSNDIRNYRFTDQSPIKGINYYRLRMIDIDATYKYSTVKSIRNTGISDISFSPNPVHQFIRLDIDAEKAERAIVRITDMTGKLVYNGYVNVVAGTNQASINTENISSGTYILNVQLSDGNLVKKFTKL